MVRSALHVPTSGRSRSLSLPVAMCLSIGLCCTGVAPLAWAETPPRSPAASVQASDSDGDGSLDSPDTVSAASAAANAGVAVEDLSQRTESARVVANPDGTFTLESFSAPVWVKNGEGAWVDVDYTLVPHSGGGFAPRAAPSTDTVVIDGGGAKEFARIDLPGGGTTTWSWPEPLPSPRLDGPTAIYTVADGVDLVVTATLAGVSTRIQIMSADAVVPAYTVLVRTDGVDLSQTDAGQLFFTDGRDRVGATSTLTAWDARLDQAGDPIEVVPLDAALTEVASDGERTDQELAMAPPAELVDDPQVAYPITLDPDIAPLTAKQDTWVRSGSGVVDTETYKLLVGRVGSSTNTNAAQSYVQWDNGPLNGKKVVKAELHLYQYFAGTCDPRQMNIHPVTSSWKETTAQWTNRPSYAADTGTSTSITTNRGGDGCADGNGFIAADITAMAQAWANGASNGGFANYGVQLNPPSTAGSDATYERRFCSINFDPSHVTCNTGDRAPFLTLKYNAAPAKPQTLSVAQLKAAGVTWSPTPTLSAKLLLAAGDSCVAACLLGEFTVKNSAGTVVATLVSGAVASGGTASVVVTPALQNLASYSVTVRAFVADLGPNPPMYSPVSDSFGFSTDVKPGTATGVKVWNPSGAPVAGSPLLVTTAQPGLSAVLPTGQWCPGETPSCLSAALEVWTGSQLVYSVTKTGIPGASVAANPPTPILAATGSYTLKVRVTHAITSQVSDTVALNFEKVAALPKPRINNLDLTDGTHFTVHVDNPVAGAVYTWTTTFTGDVSGVQTVPVSALQVDAQGRLTVSWTPTESGEVSVQVACTYGGLSSALSDPAPPAYLFA